jgi:hypothetical protein
VARALFLPAGPIGSPNALVRVLLTAPTGPPESAARVVTPADITNLEGKGYPRGQVTLDSLGQLPKMYGPATGETSLVVLLSDNVSTATITGAGDPLAGDTSKANLVETVNTVAAAGAAQTLPDVPTATINRLTLTAACTVSFPTAAAGKSFTLVLAQDATGGRTVTWPGTVKWAGGTAPTLTAAAGKVDVFTFVCADGTNWLGFTAGQNF